MDVKALVLKKLSEGGEIKVADIVKATGFSRAYLNRFFKELRDQGKIVLLGKANQARYVLADKKQVELGRRRFVDFRRILRNNNLSEEEVFDRVKTESGILLNVPRSVVRIVEYGFTEMLNNAIEHSQSTNIEVAIKRDSAAIVFKIIDRGVGVFNNIKQKKNLKSDLEAIQDLTKGKLTTVPGEHSGEGIFFTSKVADTLTLQSSTKKLIFNNALEDIFISEVSRTKGTKVIFTISLNSKRQLNKVFQEYTSDSFDFSKTKVVVKLFKLGSAFISRSQARRMLVGLEKFKMIIFDFKGVETVGQAFADEIFRVWQTRFPNKKIEYKNSNENIEFMIKRALTS